MSTRLTLWIGLLAVMLAIPISVYADGWQQVPPKGTVPDARFGHSMVLLNGKPYIFGGATTTSGMALLNGNPIIFGRATNTPLVELDDLWDYDKDNSEWEKEIPNNTLPPARKGHSAVNV